MSRPRVLHVVESYGGGVASAINSYVDATPDVEHHAIVRLRGSDYRPDGELARFESVSELGTGLGAVRAVRRTAEAIHPDVVHAHSSFGGLYARTALRTRSERRILYTPHCFAFERRDISAPMRAAFRLVEGILARWNTAEVAACSEREARLAGELAASVPTTFVPNVVPDDALAVASDPIGQRPWRLIGIGRLGPQKDPAFYIDVVEKVRQGGDVDAIWLGDGDSKLRSELEKHGIHVTGWLPRSDVYAQLAAGGVYVHSAQWEGFPMAILEAHHFGLPIAARAVGPLDRLPAELGNCTADGTAAVARALLDSEGAREWNARVWSDLLVESTRQSQAVRLTALYGADITSERERVPV